MRWCRRWRRTGREVAMPRSQIDQLRHHRGKLLQSVETLRANARIAARHQHARGPVNVQPFAARLHAHGEAGEPALEAHFVGDHALERRDVESAGSAGRAGGNPVAVHIEADRTIVRGRGAQPAVKPEPLGGEDREVAYGGLEIDGVPELARGVEVRKRNLKVSESPGYPPAGYWCRRRPRWCWPARWR